MLLFHVKTTEWIFKLYNNIAYARIAHRLVLAAITDVYAG